jgi:type I restriction enzyme M protein
MNPPFGGIEEKSVQTNFKKEYQTSETADLFMVMIMERLKENGKAGVVLPDGFLFGTEGVKRNIKEKLLKEFNLHTIVRLPNGVFSPYTGITTNLLFFDKTGTTQEVWFYEHQLPQGYKNYTKTKPIRLEEFNAERRWWNNRKENEYSWKVTIEEIQNNKFNLDYKNPNQAVELEEISVIETLDRFDKNISEIKSMIEAIRETYL